MTLIQNRISELNGEILKLQAKIKLSMSPRYTKTWKAKMIELRMRMKTNKEILKRMER